MVAGRGQISGMLKMAQSSLSPSGCVAPRMLHESASVLTAPLTHSSTRRPRAGAIAQQESMRMPMPEHSATSEMRYGVGGVACRPHMTAAKIRSVADVPPSPRAIAASPCSPCASGWPRDLSSLQANRGMSPTAHPARSGRRMPHLTLRTSEASTSLPGKHRTPCPGRQPIALVRPPPPPSTSSTRGGEAGGAGGPVARSTGGSRRAPTAQLGSSCSCSH